jgi:hypothetical protein
MMHYTDTREEIEVNPNQSEFIKGILGTYWWNHVQEKSFGPYNKKQMKAIMANNAEVLDFDLGVQRLRGVNAAQVFRNHRELRLMGYLKFGKYTHRGGGQPSAA